MARLLHLTGSPTDGFHAELSLVYARGCVAALVAEAGDAHAHVVAHVEPGGRWRFPAHPDPARLLDDDVLAAAPPVDLAGAVERLAVAGVDAALPQMFCRAGMTTYRSLLDLLGVPFLGNDAATMALGADKARTRAVLAAAGVRVPAGAVVRPGGTCPEHLRGRDVVVKPVDADNSAGVELLRGPWTTTPFDAALEAAVAVAAGHDGAGRALVEEYVPLGREVRCGVLAVGDRLVPLPLEEYTVDEVSAPVRLAADKLARDDAGALGLVAKTAAHAWIVADDDPVVPAVQAAALAAYEALGCRHYGLFDLRVDPAGVPFVLEAGLYCSYAPSSVVATMARAAGIGLPDLLGAGLAHLARPGS